MGFERLHPSIQHHVVNSLGWRELRPLQELAVDPILDGVSCLLLAPTAGGKTEAAVLPVLSRMLSSNWTGLGVLYICPIRALLNNLEERLSYYGSLVGRRCGLWHGDVRQADRARILRDPPDILLTTPESLEAILISRRTDRPYFFGNLKAVVIDEVHAFAADDRGWHLLAVLDRIAKLAGAHPQRIGLSATVGNPEEILRWMAAGTENTQVIAPPATASAQADVQLDYVGSVENAAHVVSRLYLGEKRLVFCDSRAQAERLASLIRAAGTNTFVSHSSLSVDDRRQAERAFRESRDCVIVATSTLELGIDVGDLDRVLQMDSPSTVASFLQRLGRTGRRSGTTRNCLFLATRRESLISAAALLRLWKSGYVEPLHPPPVPFPVIAQQIMAMIRQEAGISIGAGGGDSVTKDLVDHMLRADILFEDSGILGIGPQGERLYGAKNYMALMSVFDTPSLFQVVCGVEELGWVHPLSFTGFGQRPVVLSLGGRSWEVLRLDEDRSIAYVRPADIPGRSRWLGGNRALSHTFCRNIRSVLLDRDCDDCWSRRAVTEIALARDESSFVRASGAVVEMDDRTDRSKWWTFAGLKANYSLALALQSADGAIPRFDNFFVEVPNVTSALAAEQRINDIACVGSESAYAITPPGRVKFWDCLSENLRRQFFTARFTDDVMATQTLSEPRIYVTE